MPVPKLRFSFCTNSVAWRALRYFQADLRLLAILLAMIGLATLLGLLQVWPMAMLIDSVLSPQPVTGWLHQQFLAGQSQPTQIFILACAALVLRVMQEVLSLGRGMVNLKICNNGGLRVRCDLFRKLQAMHLQYHRSQPQGDAIYRLTNDTQGFQAVLQVCVDVSVAALTLVIMLVLLAARSWELTLLALAIAPVLLWTNVKFGRVLKAHSTRAKEVDSHFTATVQRSMASIGLMQAYRREAVDYRQFRTTADSSHQAWFQFQWRAALYRLSVGMIFGVGSTLILGWGAYLVYRDQFLAPRVGGMTVGDLMVFLTYLGMFYDPLCKLSGAGANLQSSLVGAERVFEVLDRDPVVEDAPDALRLPRQPRTLSFEQTEFAYEPRRPVLRPVELTIAPGEMVAFVGASGVGKSTLLNLLPRFMDPTAGRLALDGHDLRDIKLRDLRQHMALVLQETLLLPTTIAENIAYGRPGASLSEIRRAAELAGAERFIDALPEQYDTLLNEGGQNLSGGQRQRLAIARALLTEAPILVFDEPTSALDPHHERHIVDLLRSLKGPRTIILVSHRLSTVVDCDQIFVMDEGRIVERGDHRTLFAQQGLYYEMAQQQALADPALLRVDPQAA